MLEWLLMLGWQAAAWALVAFIFWHALKFHARMWRLVAARYRGIPPSTAHFRKLEVAVFAARHTKVGERLGNRGYRKYAGLVLTIHEEGLGLSLIPPFNVRCPPLFLPFDDMEVAQTDWALWAEPFAIRMRQLPDVDIIVGRETVRWLRQHINRAPFGSDL